MSELAKTSRQAMRDKAERLTSVKGEPREKVDSSSWTPPDMELAGVKTGARPLVKRLYKSGGKVHGIDAKKRGDRMARKSGGKTEATDRSKRYLTPDNLINRDVRMANDEREGLKHVGAFKKGGKVSHPDEAEDKALIKKMIKTTAMKAKGGKADGHKIDWLRKGEKVFSGNSTTKIPGEVPGGRTAHKKGGKTKGKTHININVMPHPAGGAPMAPPMGGAMPPMPPRPPMAPPAPPMGGPMGGQVDPAMLAMLAKGGAGGPMGGPSPMGGAMPPQGMPMPRKFGGRAMGKTEHVIDHAAGGGKGRLEKIKAYGKPQKRI